jgi:hypothetical protein
LPWPGWLHCYNLYATSKVKHDELQKNSDLEPQKKQTKIPTSWRLFPRLQRDKFWYNWFRKP